MRKRTSALIATGAIAALALTGCSADASGDPGAESKGDITIAVFNGWDEGVATSLLWENILTEKGYNVKLEYADPAPVFAGLSTGDYDFTTDVWLPGTHSDYVEEYGNDIVELGAWNSEASLTVAVNADAPIDSLAELAENADEFGGQIIGIEPGAGLTRTMDEAVIPGYGLEDMNFLTSSTPAMLTELSTALSSGENIVVTLWRPHWAYDAFDIKDLEDPDGALGGAESMYTYSRTGFADDFPEVAKWLENFTMDSDLLHSLENALFNEYDGDDYAPIVEDWIAQNQDWVDSLTS